MNLKSYEQFVNEEEGIMEMELRDPETRKKVKIEREYLALNGRYYYTFSVDGKAVVEMNGGGALRYIQYNDYSDGFDNVIDREELYLWKDDKVVRFMRLHDDAVLLSLHKDDIPTLL